MHAATARLGRFRTLHTILTFDFDELRNRLLLTGGLSEEILRAAHLGLVLQISLVAAIVVTNFAHTL